MIEQLSAAQATLALDDLVELLRDSVDGGASVGFLPPLDRGEARRYWADVIAEVEHGARVLLVAHEGGRVVGSAQLGLASKANARHRAEVQKLLVHSQWRGRGLGRALLSALEQAARRERRTLLVLDTRQGDVAEQLYLTHGYIRVGVIPHYARNGKGGLDPTVFYYRVLPEGGAGRE